MSKTMAKFRENNATEPVSEVMNSTTLPTPEPEFTEQEPVEDEFTRVRDDKQVVDRFFKFDRDGVEFIGRFSELWTADSEGPFEGILFTEGRETQSDNLTRVLLPTHSQLVQYFTANPTPGILYKIARTEKVDLKGGKTFVKFAIYASNK